MEPIIAIYEAYKRAHILEVYCFSCHRLLGLSPRRDFAEILKAVHRCR